MATIYIGSARIDENGNTTGGSAGDQTGNEVSTQTYYTHSKGWYCLRPTSVTYANAIATAMQQACDNNNIGYDQNQRTSYWTYLKSSGTFKAITTKCECDCSSLVRGCIYQATGKDVGDFTTSNEASVLASSGLFESKFSVSSSSELYNGDILVTKTKGHTAVVVSGRARSSSSSSSSSGSSSSKTASKSAASYSSSLAGTYTTTANLNMRDGAGTSYSVIVTLPKGTNVTNYGYYTSVSGTKWLYVQVTYNSVKYTGFCSSSYLSKSGSSTSTSSKTASKSAASYSSSLAGTYTTTANLNMRDGAGTSYSVMVTLPKGTNVTNYGYYTSVSGTKWLYVQVTYNSVKYTGFCSSSYLKKK